MQVLYPELTRYNAMRTVLLGLLLLTAACRRPSAQFAAMMTPTNQVNITDYSQPLKAGTDILANGTDPAWSLSINTSTGVLQFIGTKGDSLTTTAPERQADSDGSFRYTTGVESDRITILFRPDSCINTRSGQRYDYRVEIGFRGKSYMGCGAALQPLMLLNDIWVLTSLQGTPVSISPGREAPRLEISLAENRVMGTTGCNRLSGTLKADTRQIAFGPLMTTKMACLDATNQLESKFLNALNSPLTYRIAERQLTFFQHNRPIMTFKKVD